MSVITEARRRNEQEAALRERARSFVRYARNHRIRGDRRFAVDSLDLAAEDRLELMQLLTIARQMTLPEHDPEGHDD